MRSMFRLGIESQARGWVDKRRMTSQMWVFSLEQTSEKFMGSEVDSFRFSKRWTTRFSSCLWFLSFCCVTPKTKSSASGRKEIHLWILLDHGAPFDETMRHGPSSDWTAPIGITNWFIKRFMWYDPGAGQLRLVLTNNKSFPLVTVG
jgi:hypothetical protein